MRDVQVPEEECYTPKSNVQFKSPQREFNPNQGHGWGQSQPQD